jgi:hypothetical protein
MRISSFEISAERTTVIKRNTKGIPFFQVEEKRGCLYCEEKKVRETMIKRVLKVGKKEKKIRKT